MSLLNATRYLFYTVDRSVQLEDNNDPQQLSSNDESNDVPLDEKDERVLAAAIQLEKLKKVIIDKYS
jgi:hypothetical protein